MSIVLFSESRAPELAHVLGGRDLELQRYLLHDAFKFPPFASNGADIVLLDCGSNVDCGLRALRGLKEKCPGTPVIFLTDQSSEDVAIAAFRAGARDYFRKPLDILQLRNVVGNLLRIKQTTRERREPYTCSGVPLETPAVHVMSNFPEGVLRAVVFLEEHFAEDLSLEEVSRVACMSKFHFARVFRKHTGMSVVQFRTRMRVEKARYLLACSRLSVAQIASAVGFNDFSNFTRQFKKITGTTPKRYRNGTNHHSSA